MNYQHIAAAIRFYEARGYVWIDTPWIVDQDSKCVTFSGEMEACAGGYLVGSAEQGFIQLVRDGKLIAGKYVSAGPCFRFDDKDRPGKHPYFFKVELCIVGTRDYRQLYEDALAYFQTRGEAFIMNTTEGVDIEINGIEVGSYGFRAHQDLPIDLAYGTGLAEPRCSEAVLSK